MARSTDAEYRGRLVHEFDEDLDAYEHKVQDEVSRSVNAVDDEQFVQSYSRFPTPTDEYREIEDNEALEGYRHMANGAWGKLNRGQVICLKRHLKAIQKNDAKGGADSQNVQYQDLEDTVDELDYTLTLESELDRTGNRYLVDTE